MRGFLLPFGQRIAFGAQPVGPAAPQNFGVGDNKAELRLRRRIEPRQAR